MDKDVKVDVNSVSTLLRDLPKFTGDMNEERRRFKADVASSVALVWGRKQLRVANNGNKVTPWWIPWTRLRPSQSANEQLPC